MIDCMILGDKIAVGISNAVTHCRSYADSELNSQTWNNVFLNKVNGISPQITIISLGSNDSEDIDTERELLKLRGRIRGNYVYWILPNSRLNPLQEDIVRKVANDFGDIVVLRTMEYQSDDETHYTLQGYKNLADKIFQPHLIQTNFTKLS